MLRVTIVALIISMIFLAYRAERRRGYRPFWVGLAASISIVAGKFIYDIPVLYYSGVVLLIVTSLWNSWPKKKSALPLPKQQT
jgi:hypothetical protein